MQKCKLTFGGMLRCNLTTCKEIAKDSVVEEGEHKTIDFTHLIHPRSICSYSYKSESTSSIGRIPQFAFCLRHNTLIIGELRFVVFYLHSRFLVASFSDTDVISPTDYNLRTTNHLELNSPAAGKTPVCTCPTTQSHQLQLQKLQLLGKRQRADFQEGPWLLQRLKTHVNIMWRIMQYY